MSSFDPADLAACRALLREGSKSFAAAAQLLPRRVRDPATVLYAFCRLADDAIDQEVAPADGLTGLHQRLTLIYAGAPNSIATDRALAVVVQENAIPHELFAALLEGFAWDVKARQYETFDSLLDYAARVAGTVGMMMALVVGCRDPALLARAGTLGVAMQLVNIARDVGEDAQRGRIYLPLEWLREAGVSPNDFLNRPKFSHSLGDVVARLLREADRLFVAADPAIGRLPLPSRAGIGAARWIYAAIGNAVAAAGYDSVNARRVVSARQKYALIGKSLARSFIASRWQEMPPLSALQFLLGSMPRVVAPLIRPAWWNISAQILWSAELFKALETRPRARA